MYISDCGTSWHSCKTTRKLYMSGWGTPWHSSKSGKESCISDWGILSIVFLLPHRRTSPTMSLKISGPLTAWSTTRGTQTSWRPRPPCHPWWCPRVTMSQNKCSASSYRQPCRKITWAQSACMWTLSIINCDRRGKANKDCISHMGSFVPEAGI